MITLSSETIEHAQKNCAAMKTVFFRNDKSDLIIQQKWVTGNLQVT